MKIKKCFIKDYQGHRWLFRKQKYGNNYDMEDTCGEFPPIELRPDVASILSSQLNILQEYQNEDKQELLMVNLILEFILENKDVDKDIMIALINNWEHIVRGKME